MLLKLVNSSKEDNTDLVASIQEKLNGLTKGYYNTLDDEKAINKKLNTIMCTVNEVLVFNKKYHNQQGQALKILTLQQMFSKLPISLAQLKAGINSQKLKNKIRQILYSFFRSKKLSKTIYKHLMNTII